MGILYDFEKATNTVEMRVKGCWKAGTPVDAKVDEAAGDAPTAAEFKALLDALKAAGIMATT